MSFEQNCAVSLAVQTHDRELVQRTLQGAEGLPSTSKVRIF